ncbi:copper-containing nitrite reductase [Sphingomonas limnosediminicola]|uniref:Copper-containing nitrite reductase n=1 Tax=Sphingomonas limnosediminicola TaxID=940133 RepID=A0ABP7LW13_9SPHN
MKPHRQLLLASVAALLLAVPAFAAEGPAVQPAAPVSNAADIVRDPADLPGPLARRTPATVTVNLETVEITGRLDDGTTYDYWTYNRKVPGPFIRVRVGDTVVVNLKNDGTSGMMHNIDLHAVSGPGGGAVATMARPGEAKGFTFKALHPGLYVYHCAVPMAAQHIANGMYGMILVEPGQGLPKVDHEYYVMQGEIYTEQPNGTKGELTQSIDKLIAEQPDYMVFNGAVDGLARKPLKAKTGETVRIFFGDGGPDKDSSFHIIGGIFDSALPYGSFDAPAVGNVQTITVPPGGAAVVEFKPAVPGKFFLVDHALSRVEKGLKGTIEVSGEARADLFRPNQPVDSALAASSGH